MYINTHMCIHILYTCTTKPSICVVHLPCFACRRFRLPSALVVQLCEAHVDVPPSEGRCTVSAWFP